MDFRKTSILDVQVLELPKVESRAGNITSINSSIDLPFDIERVYYLYDIPGGEFRGAHAHKELSQLIVAASGSFTVRIYDGKVTKEYFLNRPYQGLLLKPGLWRELVDFSSGSICLVLASHAYDEADYIRDLESYKSFKYV